MLRFQFHLSLRATQGFAKSLVQLMSLNLEVPDYSTLSRRLAKCEIQMGSLKSSEPIHVVIDSTGLKVFGEGEWKVRQHGYSKRRTWQKLHLCVDEENQQVVSVSLTDNSFKDSELFEDLVSGLEESIEQASADGAYDSENCWDHCAKNNIQGTFPPRKDARLKQHGNSKEVPLQRDEHIRGIRKGGRKQWKKDSGYSRRSLAETAMYRFKALLGDKLSSREFDRQAMEAFIKCKILNKMTVPAAL